MEPGRSIFYLEDLPSDCRLECPKCLKRSFPDKWLETEVPCESCGEHPGVICPNCNEEIDVIFYPLGGMAV